MIISHNIQAMNTNRITNENISLHGKSTEKISSGYRINRGVDDPAGLGISEVMRRQIRGLMQATNNTKDGVAFVQSADGAMEGVHSILQRMNELTVKALQGTYSDGDRMAMNVEFDQLRTEIDRINNTTEFGTGIPVFEEHESSYYQISGNRKWDDNQLHTISSMANALNIHLPDSYEPKDYTITIPAGTYTTQELVDEIDDALSNMVPPNPGFVFELTSDGYCNLRFEKADGTPTKINYVDGSLAYLLYDFKAGMGSNDILGTTIFEVDRELMIFEDKNDELGFYLEGVPNTPEITITIPAGAYTREDLIKKINASLPTEYGIAAAPYGDHCIQITSGSDVSVTGLHGNMFKYEETKPVYTSVLYDNVKYGSCDKSSAGITGQYYPSDYKIEISDANKNNKLKFKLNDSSKDVEIGFPDGEYTIFDLVNELNNQLKDLNVEAQGVNNLSLYSTIEGEHSILEFDITSEFVYENTYKTLFLNTYKEPSTEEGNLATVLGIPDLSGDITFESDDSLIFTLNNETKPYILGIPKNTYTLGTLVTHLNSQLGDNDRIEFATDNDVSPRHLVIKGRTGDVKSINMVGTNASKMLITTKLPVPDGKFVPETGKKETIQGTNIINCVPKKITVTSSPCKDEPITITENSNTLTLEITQDNVPTRYTITLDPGGPYSIPELASEINKKLQNSDSQYLKHIEISYDKGLQFTLNLEHNDIPDGNWKINIPFDPMTDALNDSIWKAVFKTEEKDVYNRQDQKPATLTTVPLGTDIEINKDNSTLELSIDGGKNYVKLPIDEDIYKTPDSLADAIRKAIENSALKGIVSVSVYNGRIRLTADSGTFEAKGTFYDEVMCKGTYSSSDSSARLKGSCNYVPAFIIGRQDLTVEPIEIISGSNDEFIFNITHNGVKKEITEIRVEITEGIYSGKDLAVELKKGIQKQIHEKGFDYFEVDVSIGGHPEIDLPNTDNSTVLQITLNRAPGKEPDGGEYIIDGIRGSAATTVFYKSNSAPTMSYIVGTKDIREGISFEPGKNVLTLTANSVSYKYTFDKPHYTADEFLDALNSMFEKGDDNGNSAPLRATIDKSGALKLSYTVAGAHAITDIGGSARGAIFFEEEGRDSRDPLLIHVGNEAHQYTEIPRISVSSAALAINSITISKQKYAEKANVRIKDAIKTLSSKRSTYGAIQNRLEHTINNNDIIVDRVQASESRIRDTDLSTEMIQYSNLSILLKMGSTMIAETNQRIEKIMTLLQ